MTEILFKVTFSVAFLYLLIYFFTVVNERVVFPTLTTMVLLWQTLLFAGTILQAKIFDRAFDLTRLGNITIGILLFVVGARLANAVSGFSPRKEFAEFRERAVIFDVHSGVYWFLIILMGVVALVIGIWQASTVGYHVTWEALLTVSDSSAAYEASALYSTLRTGISNSVMGWVAPGYVMQFTGVLLPVVIYLLYIRYAVKRSRLDLFVLLLFLAPMLYLVTFKGQRSTIVLFAVWFLLLVSKRWGPLGSLNVAYKRLPLLVGLLAALFFVVGTNLMGRNTATGTWYGDIWTTIVDLYERAVLITSRNQLLAMDIFRERAFTWGQGWLDSISILLPGSAEALASEISALIGGNPNGSAPPDLWTSIWLDFGWLGMLVVPGVLGYLFQAYTIRFIRGPKRLTRLVVLFVAGLVLYDVGEPISVFNNGFATLMIYYLLIRLIQAWERRGRESSGEDRVVGQMGASALQVTPDSSGAR